MDVLGGPGTVIILSGPSSTGKTSVAEILRRTLPRPTIFLNGDELDLPDDSLAVQTTLRALPRDQVSAMEEHFHRGYFGALASFATSGLHAIGEVLFKDEHALHLFQAQTEHVPTLVVHLRCDDTTRQERERQRGDRPIGTAAATGAQEWVPPQPNLAIDTTSIPPPEAALLIRDRLERVR